MVREFGDAAQIDGSSAIVRDRVVPQVRSAPGFVSAVWLSDGSGRTLNVLVFESEEAASAALDRARSAARPPFMRLESVDLFGVLATA
ncbi:MAG TPA: hypothetical protein VFI34_01960 [Candidatus Limnocylindrales bacterium]|nr:hypothetical protein [Candidatus Limnocylindrales bacterium]